MNLGNAKTDANKSITIFQVIRNFFFNIGRYFLKKISENTRKSLSEYLSAMSIWKIADHSRVLCETLLGQTQCLWCVILYVSKAQRKLFVSSFLSSEVKLIENICLFANIFRMSENFYCKTTKDIIQLHIPKTNSLA